jgi:hypothetical protein
MQLAAPRVSSALNFALDVAFVRNSHSEVNERSLVSKGLPVQIEFFLTHIAPRQTGIEEMSLPHLNDIQQISYLLVVTHQLFRKSFR